MTKRRYFSWAFLITTPLILVISLFLAIPFRSEMNRFDRHSGLVKKSWVYFGIFSVVRESSGPGNIAARYGKITAPHTTYPSYTSVKRFPWSETAYGENIEPGYSMQKLYWSLFGLVRIAQFEGKTMSIEEARPILERRVEIWNSHEVDSDPKKLLELIDQENETIIQNISTREP